MTRLEKLYEGKAKIVYATDDPDVYIQDFKDSATAFDGTKKGTITRQRAHQQRHLRPAFHAPGRGRSEDALPGARVGDHDAHPPPRTCSRWNSCAGTWWRARWPTASATGGDGPQEAAAQSSTTTRTTPCTIPSSAWAIWSEWAWSRRRS